MPRANLYPATVKTLMLPERQFRRMLQMKTYARRITKTSFTRTDGKGYDLSRSENGSEI